MGWQGGEAQSVGDQVGCGGPGDGGPARQGDFPAGGSGSGEDRGVQRLGLRGPGRLKVTKAALESFLSQSRSGHSRIAPSLGVAQAGRRWVAGAHEGVVYTAEVVPATCGV